MPIRKHSHEQPDLEVLKSVRLGIKKKIFIAIAIVILLTVVAMTGVYYEYW